MKNKIMGMLFALTTMACHLNTGYAQEPSPQRNLPQLQKLEKRIAEIELQLMLLKKDLHKLGNIGKSKLTKKNMPNEKKARTFTSLKLAIASPVKIEHHQIFFAMSPFKGSITKYEVLKKSKTERDIQVLKIFVETESELMVLDNLSCVSDADEILDRLISNGLTELPNSLRKIRQAVLVD